MVQIKIELGWVYFCLLNKNEIVEIYDGQKWDKCNVSTPTLKSMFEKGKTIQVWMRIIHRYESQSYLYMRDC